MAFNMIRKHVLPSSQQSLDARGDEFETLAPRSTVAAASAGAAQPQLHDHDAGQDVAACRSGAGLSLKARAVGYLSRREYARNELARKLLPHAEQADIDTVLDALEKEGWLSTERFAHSLVHRRAARQGTARIVQALHQHGVGTEQVAALRDTLRASEYPRALEVWRKRFGHKPADRAAYAKQARFLAGRGFAADVIRRILGDDHDDD